MVHTPAIKENIDSLELSFNLNNDNYEIQSMCITFPCSILEKPILVNTKPIKVNNNYLELLAENYLCEFLENRDSVVVLGTFAIPAIIDYSAKTETGAKCISGYTKSVDGILSAINDIAYFDRIFNYTTMKGLESRINYIQGLMMN